MGIDRLRIARTASPPSPKKTRAANHLLQSCGCGQLLRFGDAAFALVRGYDGGHGNRNTFLITFIFL